MALSRDMPTSSHDWEVFQIAQALAALLQEEILEETAGLDGPMLAPTPPSTPKRNSEAKDANPWEASWGDLLSSQESDSEFDRDSSQSSNSGAVTAKAADSGLRAGATGAIPPDAQTEATGSSLTKHCHPCAQHECCAQQACTSMDVACRTTGHAWWQILLLDLLSTDRDIRT